MLDTLFKTLGTREVDRFLAGFHDIADDHRSAYAGRLKHLTRGGFPPGVSVGPGVAVRYDADMLFQMLVVTQLWQHGVSPARAIALVTEAWPRLRGDVLRVWLSVEASNRDGKPAKSYVDPIYWRVPVEALRHMARPDRPYSLDLDDRIDTMTTGRSRSLASARTAETSCRPVIRGMSTSLTSRSNGSARTLCHPSMPSTATVTSYPLCRRSWRSTSRTVNECPVRQCVAVRHNALTQ